MRTSQTVATFSLLVAQAAPASPQESTFMAEGSSLGNSGTHALWRDETVRQRDARVTQMVIDHFDFVWRLLRRLGFESHEADDATQEVFLVALRRLQQIKAGCERTFLYGAALRTAHNARRSRLRRREVSEEQAPSTSTAGDMPDELAQRTRTIAVLDELLMSLPPEMARALILSEVMELEAKEIASLEQIPVGTVASRLRRAKKVFRRKLARFANEVPFKGVEP
jgi:RNA polymerase sigma-70 factor (ECF subfamily)